MLRRVVRPLRAALFAVVALASAAVPAAMALPGHMEMPAHGDAAGADARGHRSPEQPAHTRGCCDLCVVACGAAVTPFVGVAWHARALLPAVVGTIPFVAGHAAGAQPHRQPLAIGPPSLRA